jgi:predicted permease
MGIVIGFSVPIVNMAAVWALARHSESDVLREMLRNPLLLATLSGLAFNFSGLTLPEPVSATLSRLGAASIALSLIAVGASLSLDRLNIARTALIYFTLVKMVLLPLATLGLARLTGLSGLGLQIALLFAALPTASSAYVLAQRMGGNGAVVAAAITIGTMLSAISIPFWMTKI